jgi:hypothetical protein
MLIKRTEFVRFALCAALCGIPAVSIAGRAQDQTPPTEHKQQDREKNRTDQDERKETRASETKPRSHAAQGRQDHPTEGQPRDRSAERSAQERQSHSTEERPRNSGAQPQKREQTAQSGTHRPAPNAHYQFRQQDVPRLRQHFQSQLAHVDRNHPPHVVAGGSLPGSWQTYIVPVPTEVITYLPPVPEGYQLGFYSGYIIVYDPYSGLVLDVIDLFAY